MSSGVRTLIVDDDFMVAKVHRAYTSRSAGHWRRRASWRSLQCGHDAAGGFGRTSWCWTFIRT